MPCFISEIRYSSSLTLLLGFRTFAISSFRGGMPRRTWTVRSARGFARHNRFFVMAAGRGFSSQFPRQRFHKRPKNIGVTPNNDLGRISIAAVRNFIPSSGPKDGVHQKPPKTLLSEILLHAKRSVE